jgi:hypothetical protein
MPLPILGKASVACNVGAAHASSRAHPNVNAFIVLRLDQTCFHYIPLLSNVKDLEFKGFKLKNSFIK